MINYFNLHLNQGKKILSLSNERMLHMYLFAHEDIWLSSFQPPTTHLNLYLKSETKAKFYF